MLTLSLFLVLVSAAPHEATIAQQCDEIFSKLERDGELRGALFAAMPPSFAHSLRERFSNTCAQLSAADRACDQKSALSMIETCSGLGAAFSKALASLDSAEREQFDLRIEPPSLLLRQIAMGAWKLYVSAETLEGFRFPDSVEATPKADCCQEPTHRCHYVSADWEQKTWRTLGFKPSDPQKQPPPALASQGFRPTDWSPYHLEFRSSGAGKNASFSARAWTDVSCDGKKLVWEVTGRQSGGTLRLTDPAVLGETARVLPPGAELAFRIQAQKTDKQRSDALLGATQQSVEKRLLGLGALVVRREDRIIVKLPPGNAHYAPDVKRRLLSSAWLDFREVDDGAILPQVMAAMASIPGLELQKEEISTPTGEKRQVLGIVVPDEATARAVLAAVPKEKLPTGSELLLQSVGSRKTVLLLALKSEFSKVSVVSAAPTFGNSGHPGVSVQLDADGGRKFEALSARAAGHRIAIVLDGRVLMAPVVMGPIKGGSLQVSLPEGASVSDASELALQLSAGELPATLQLD